MAGPFQVGDIINFGRLAWEVYQLGWAEDLSATRQYNEFGRDVRGLAESLDILTRVVSQARSSLQRQGAYNAVVRWDPGSLRSIIGDYETTLRECDRLIKSNSQYTTGSTALQNIGWNVLVQPSADRLRQRIALHNSKILHVLKPFEIDLLCRVREDIYRVHHDLATRITAVHHDLNRLMGVLIPDLEQTLNQQAHREIRILQVPFAIEDRFRFTALSDRPEYSTDAAFELEELSDAFVLNYNKSSIGFRSGLIVTDRIPPLEQYLNLLKCVWLFRKIQSSPSLPSAETNSHWPRYVQQLEDDLSAECSRYDQELVEPELVTPALRGDMFSIWPETEPAQLVDVVTQDEMMEQVLEVALERSGKSVQRGIKLLRRMGADGRRFRIMISGVEQAATGRPRRQTEVIDFDVTSAIINPQYALPTSNGMMKELILRRDERIAKLSFEKTSHILKFQQAVTGYKVWAGYSQYNAFVSFVVAGRMDPVVERACIQLWIPLAVDGSLVTNADVAADTNPNTGPNRSATDATSTSNGTAYSRRTSNTYGSPPTSYGAIPIPELDGQSERTVTNDNMSRSPEAVWSSPTMPSSSQFTVPRKPIHRESVSSAAWPRFSSPPPISCSPPEGPSVFLTGNQPYPPRVQRGSNQASPPQLGFLSANGTNGMAQTRSLSVSSAVSTPPSNGSMSSSGDSHTTTIATGARTTGLLHRRPPKSMLVFFTESIQDGSRSFVTVQMDEQTAINPERCNCRQSGRAGAACDIAAIERNKGDANLDARRYEVSRSGNGTDWNLARLAVNNPASTSDAATWSNVKRISIKFPHAEDRAMFGGTPNQCHCNKKNQTQAQLTECLRMGHRGLWGEVLEYYRKKGREYHDRRFGEMAHVVNGLPSRDR